MTVFKIISVLFFITFCFNNIFSQAYGTAIGMRLMDGIGATVQQQVSLHTTVEAILQSDGPTKNDVTLSLLGEQHHNILLKGFNFYTGGGVFYSWVQQDSNLKIQPGNPVGLTGIAGIEIKLGHLVFSTDVKPSVRVFGSGGMSFALHSGFSIRYVLADRIFRNNGWMFWKKRKKYIL